MTCQAVMPGAAGWLRLVQENYGAYKADGHE